MAGIGFKLQKIVSRESYSSVIKGFMYALVLTSGPWLIIVMSLGTLSVYSTFFVLIESRQLFKILLVHNYLITIIVTGTLQLFFTRIFADKMYHKKREDLPNVIMCNLMTALACVTVVSMTFLAFVDVTFITKFLTYIFFVSVTITWVLINYVSASDNFFKFIKHYLIGATASLILGYGLSYLFDFIGMYSGFILGQMYIAIMLFLKTIKIFGFPKKIDFMEITSKYYYRNLLLSGFLLYAGMWIDKLLLWYGPSGKQFNSILYYNPDYDDVFYLAFLFSAPIMAIFFLIVETDFYKAYFRFYKTMLKKGKHGNLDKIKQAGKQLITCVDSSLWLLLIVQIVFTLAGVLFSKQILNLINMSEQIDTLFALVLIGRFFQLMMMLVCVLLLYFDLRQEAIKVYGLFFALNLLLTLGFLQLGSQFDGTGMVIASFICFLYATRQLKYYLKKSVYYTFTKRPLPYAKKSEKKVLLQKTDSYGRYYIKDGKHLIEP